jgi:hypothetical protein
MNYGMDELLSAWSGLASGSNPGSGLRRSLEHSGFADLFDSNVRFAATAGTAAAAAPGASISSEKAVAGLVEGAEVMSSMASDLRTLGHPQAAAEVFIGAPGRVAGSLPAAAPAVLVRAAVSTEAGAIHSAPPRPLLDPTRCQWSRTAFAACLREGELDLSIRDGALPSDPDAVDTLRRAIQGLGLNLAKLKINGIQASL